MTLYANLPAFPTADCSGLTTREYIATACLASFAGRYGADQAANLAVIFADALLTRLAGPEGAQQPADPDEEVIDLEAAGMPVDEPVDDDNLPL